MLLSLHTLYSERLQIILETYGAENALLLDTCLLYALLLKAVLGFILEFPYFCFTNQLHIVSVLFVLRSQSVLNAVELD